MGSGNHVYEVCKVIYYIAMKEGGRRKLVIYPLKLDMVRLELLQLFLPTVSLSLMSNF